MKRITPLILILSLLIGGLQTAMASFICKEPGGKRLIEIQGNEVSRVGGKTLIYIDGNDLLLGDTHAKPFLVVDEDDVRPAVAGVIIAHFDASELRHGPDAEGRVLMDYRYPNLSPSHSAPRSYTVEGEMLNKQQLIAGLYLLQPELFKLTDEETAAQQKAMHEAGAEADRLAAQDHMAGKWQMLNGHGPVAKVGSGFITIGTKLGDAYPLTFDYTQDGGPKWTGVGVYKEYQGDKLFWTAYGTEKTIGLCVYEIKLDGTLEGKWYPWYLDGTAKNTGTETLKGPADLNGDYTIVSAAAPTTGATYGGTVEIKPLEIVGAGDHARPYSLLWTIGTYKIHGIGIRTGNMLFVASGTGADVNIARFTLGNGTMNSDWFKLGSLEKGQSAAMSP